MVKSENFKFKCSKCNGKFANPPKLAEHYKKYPAHQSLESQKLAAAKLKARLGRVEVATALPTVSVTRTAQVKYTVKFCTNCGARRAASHKFCGGCGSRL